MKYIKERMKTRRKELGITAEALGKALGKDRATVYRYENGSIEIPITVVEALPSILNTSLLYLLGLSPQNDEWTDCFCRNVKRVLTTSDRHDLLAAGVDIERVEAIVNGNIPLSFYDACQIADEFGCSLDDLVQLEKPAAPRDDEFDKLRRTFMSLNEDNRTKLIELCRLFLAAQSNDGSNP